ncbi:Spy0128 family protein [Bifidobacterium miconisargentati]|uniref:Spy0128 family protein n=1 Tax=Bifidobacterium miconisargentati TaxID=2834437 RepID=UPI001BDCA65A|nr:FctA domain-containing protein [Bifidobacterium miconisargentati]MBW3090074.1 Cna B-type domain-containing protein [Bifidobacterium miconisargentati]
MAEDAQPDVAQATTVKVSDEQGLVDAINAAAGDGVTIEVDGDIAISKRIPVKSKISLTGTGKLTFGEKAGLRVTDTGDLTLDGPTLDGGGETVAHKYPIVYSEGSLTIQSGEVSDYHASTASRDSDVGSAVTVYGGTFTMNGGSITNNSMNSPTGIGGGGLQLLGGVSKITAIMNGGTISGNTVDDSGRPAGEGGMMLGGGIAILGARGPVDFTMNGGVVSGNTLKVQQATANGGGIGIWGLGNPAYFTMNNGTVDGNKVHGALAHGGGIGAGTHNPVTINAGKITNNESDGMGGGIYTDDGRSSVGSGNPNAHNEFHNLLVTGNTASNLGGGIWLCPTGAGNTYVTEGGAVYGNSAPGDADTHIEASSAAGDDFVAHPRPDANKVTLSDRMLGGGVNHWYTDGGTIKNTDAGGPDPVADGTVARYDSTSDANDEQTVTGNTDPLALKNVTTSDAQELSKALAKIVVSGNKAMLGGGIASNSTITIGKPDAQEISITVNKKWDSSVAEADRKAIKVQLKVTGTLNGQTIDKVIDEATLDETGNWTHTFTGLPAEDTLNGLKYQVVEVGDEYESNVGEFQKDETDANHWTMTVTNKAKKPTDTTLTIPGTKTLNGGTLTAGQFRFQIKAKNPSTAPLPTDTIVTNKADDSFSFGPITYKESDLNGRDSADFEYEITEVKGTDSTVIYDDTVYDVKVTLSKQQDGSLKAEYSITVDGQEKQSVAFTNTITPPGPPVTPPDKPDTPSTDITIPGTKSLRGRDLQAGEFSFTIKAKNPTTAPLPVDKTVSNKADGSFSFGPIAYRETDLNGKDSADFEYEITEVKGTDSTVTYDDAVYTVKVAVSKVSNRLNVTYTVFDKNGDTVDSIAFDNTVKPDKPDKPDQPTTPDTPNQPEQPNQPGKPDTPGTPGQPTTPTQPDKPQKPTLSVTGSSVTAAAVVTVLALACGLAMFVVRRHTAVNKTARSHHSR